MSKLFTNKQIHIKVEQSEKLRIASFVFRKKQSEIIRELLDEYFETHKDKLIEV